MNRLRIWIACSAVAALLLCTQGPSQAQSAEGAANPSTQPTTRPDRRDRGGENRDEARESRSRERQGGYMMPRAGDNYRNEELPTEEEWAEIIDFMKTSSPVRLEMYEKLAETFKDSVNERPIIGARKRMAGRYRDLMMMKERHPDMFEFALKQTVLEDQILGLMREIRDGGENEPRSKKFRELVTAYVDNFLNEREARLKRLREMVERDTKSIEKDRGRMDELVDKQSEKFEKEMSRLIDFWEDPDRFKPQAQPTP